MNILEAYMKANQTKFLKQNKLIKKQLIREEKKHPPDECIECIFFYGSYEKNGKKMSAKCAISGRYTVTGEPPKWCGLKGNKI